MYQLLSFLKVHETTNRYGSKYASKSNDQREDQLALDIEIERTTGFAEFMEAKV